jgi:hypothetical protein
MGNRKRSEKEPQIAQITRIRNLPNEPTSAGIADFRISDLRLSGERRSQTAATRKVARHVSAQSASPREQELPNEPTARPKVGKKKQPRWRNTNYGILPNEAKVNAENEEARMKHGFSRMGKNCETNPCARRAGSKFRSSRFKVVENCETNPFQNLCPFVCIRGSTEIYQTNPFRSLCPSCLRGSPPSFCETNPCARRPSSRFRVPRVQSPGISDIRGIRSQAKLPTNPSYLDCRLHDFRSQIVRNRQCGNRIQNLRNEPIAGDVK